MPEKFAATLMNAISQLLRDQFRLHAGKTEAAINNLFVIQEGRC
ncbi:MAG: hypothetical protein P8M72_11090 [Gammaproteobacteria bacterium]|nr:hypothetical protein [Gammaproteobacteria bacterium]